MSDRLPLPELQIEFQPLTPLGSPEQEAIDYPIDLLPPRMRRVVDALIIRADCHPNTAAWAVVGSASAVAQCVATVETLGGAQVPLSLFTHLIAASGARKSTVFHAAWQGISDADRTLQKAHVERKARRNEKAKPGDSDYSPCRGSGTIKQVITEPTIEALIRDMEIGYPFPALASAEGATFYRGYSAGSNSARSTQTASTLAAAYSGEDINVARIGSEGRAPNRSVSGGQYALGMHYAVQNTALGYGLVYGGQDSEFGMSARVLLFETPPKETLLPKRYTAEETANADKVIAEWTTFTRELRQHPDQRILETENGCPPRASLYLTEEAKDRVHGILGNLQEMAVDSPPDQIIYERIGEQIIRIAGTLQVSEDGMVPGTRVPLGMTYIGFAATIAQHHWLVRQRIDGASLAKDIDEACVSIVKLAIEWKQNGAGASGKRGYDPDTVTWGWATLLQRAKHTGRRGRYGGDSEFKLKVRDRLIATGHMARADRKVVFSEECLAQGY